VLGHSLEEWIFAYIVEDLLGIQMNSPVTPVVVVYNFSTNLVV
jgi:hypothetical protein